MAKIATVASVSGDAFVVGLDGTVRALKVGDAIEVGETIRTAAGARVELVMDDGQTMAVAPEQNVRVDEALVQADNTPGGQESTVQPGTVDQIAQILEQGGDLTQELEAAAAGGGAGGGGDGSGFVRLLRIAEGTDPLAFNYSFAPLPSPDEVLLAADAPTPAAEPVVGNVTLRYIELDEEGQPRIAEGGGFVYIDGKDVIEGTPVGLVAEVDVAPTGSDLVLTLSNGDSIIISVGSTSGYVPVEIRGDEVYIQGTDLVDVSITGATGGQYDELNIDQSTDFNVVDDADQSTATLTSEGEGNEDAGSVTYTVTLTSAPEADQEFKLTLSNGQEVTLTVVEGALSGEVTVAWGVEIPEDAVALDGYPDSDFLAEEDFELTATIEAVGNAGNYEDLVVVNDSTPLSIGDSIDVVTIKVFAVVDGQLTDANSVAEGATATYVAHAVDPDGNVITGATGDVTITFTNGSAESEDYSTTTTSVALGTEFTAEALDDYISDNNETFTVGASNYTNAAAYETVAYGDAVTTTIVDNTVPGTEEDAETVTIKVFAVVDGQLTDANSVAEGATATYVAHAVDPDGNVITGATGDVTITFTNGSAESEDYSTTTTSVALGTEFTAEALDDYISDNNETFTVGASNYTNAAAYETVAYGDAVTTTIVDNTVPGTEEDAETVTLKLLAVDAQGNEINTSTIAEGETAYYKVVALVNGVVNSSITGNVGVTFTNNGTTTNADYTPSTTTVAIGAVFSATAVDDTFADNGETFTVTLEDGSFNNAAVYETVAYEGSVTTTITDEAPTTAPDAYETDEDTALTISVVGDGVLGNDTGDGGLTVQSYTQPTHGTLTLNTDGTFTYTPTSDYSGADSFTYTAVDGNGVATDPVTVALQVNPVTDTPTVELTLTPQVSSQLYAADLFNVLTNPDGQVGNPLGFTVTAYKDGVVGDIAIRYLDGNGVELSPTGFGVAGAASNGADVEIGQGEKLVIALDSPASSVTFELAWLNSTNETAVYTVRYSDGTSQQFTITSGGDQVEAPVTTAAPAGKTIEAIEFSTPTTGDRVSTSDYMLHSVSYVSATLSYSVDIVATPTDTDYSESIVSLQLTAPAGVMISDATLVSTVGGVSTWVLIVDGDTGPTVNVDDVTGVVTVSGLTLTVPADYTGDMTVTATAYAQDGTASQAWASDSVTVDTDVVPSAAYFVMNTSNTGGGGDTGYQTFTIYVSEGEETLSKTVVVANEQGQQEFYVQMGGDVVFAPNSTFTVALEYGSGSAHLNFTEFSLTDKFGNVLTMNANGGSDNTTLQGGTGTSYDGVLYTVSVDASGVPTASDAIGYDVNGLAGSAELVLDSLGNSDNFSLDLGTLPLDGTVDMFGEIARINISGDGTGEDNTLTISAQDVLDLADSTTHDLYIKGDVGDAVVLKEHWASAGSTSTGGVSYDHFTYDLNGTTLHLYVESELTKTNPTP